MENNKNENAVTGQPFEPVSIRVVDIAPRNVLCTSGSDTPETVDGLTIQSYNNGGSI